VRECALCDAVCDSSLGFSWELKTVYWGGSKGNIAVDYSPKRVFFFCSEEHRASFLVQPVPGSGEVQTERWNYTGDE
jgi:hypothetical protein